MVDAAVVDKPTILNEPPPPTPPSMEQVLFKDKPAPAPAPGGPTDPTKANVPAPEPAKAAPVAAEPPKSQEPPKPEQAPAAATTTPPAGEKPSTDYELKLPEGSLLSQDELDSIQKQAKESSWTQAQAEGILTVRNDAVKSYVSRQQSALQKARDDWKSACATDPVIGGPKFAENAELAKRAWARLADPELKELAEKTGFGNHPSVLRTFVAIGRMFAEDQMVRGTAGAPPKERSHAAILFGESSPEPVA